MTDREALLRAVAAAPADDLPRLVLADWLDDHGEAERAAYVRASVELARLVAAEGYGADGYPSAVAAVAGVPAEVVWGWLTADGWPVPPAPAVLARETVGPLDYVRDVSADLSVGFRRGLPEVVRCRAESWVRLARPAATLAPIARVELTDRRPYHHRPREWVWRLPEGSPGGPSNVLPMGVFTRLPGHQNPVAAYRTRKDADAALSAACLAFARGRPTAG